MMKEEDIRAAARDASMRIGIDRQEFLKNYPEEYRKDIEYLASKLDDMANNEYDDSRINPCIYNRGFTYGV